MDVRHIFGTEADEMATKLPGGVIVYEAGTKAQILYANPVALNLFGCENYEQLLEMTEGSFFRLIHPGDLDSIREKLVLRTMENSDVTENVVYRIVKRDGSVCFVESFGKQVTDEQGKQYYFVLLADFSEKKHQLETEGLIQYLRQLESLFQIVRLVDVSKAVVCKLTKDGTLIEQPSRCYSVWEKEHRCENCISAKAYACRGQLTKYEFRNQEPYQVIAKYVEIGEKPYILELVNKVDVALLDAYGQEKLAETIQEYNRRMYIDALTGAFNRNYLEEQLGYLSGISAIAMMDIDYFKSVNDTFGHDAGDEALKMYVKTVTSCIRPEDTLIRIGGDEFLAVFEQISEEELRDCLNTICEKVRNSRCREYPDMRVTTSIGAVMTDHCDVASRKCADQALYAAKECRDTARIWSRV